jgi:hypothetical protein
MIYGQISQHGDGFRVSARAARRPWPGAARPSRRLIGAGGTAPTGCGPCVRLCSGRRCPVSMVLWVTQGMVTGDNRVTANEDSLAVSASLDTLISVGTNAAGRTVLSDPFSASAVDVAVLLYDIGRLPSPYGPMNDASPPMSMHAVRPSITIYIGPYRRSR